MGGGGGAILLQSFTQLLPPSIPIVSSILQENSDPDLNVSTDENSAYKSSVPKRYKKIDIKLGKMGVDDFDFDSYNKV